MCQIQLKKERKLNSLLKIKRVRLRSKDNEESQSKNVLGISGLVLSFYF